MSKQNDPNKDLAEMIGLAVIVAVVGAVVLYLALS